MKRLQNSNVTSDSNAPTRIAIIKESWSIDLFLLCNISQILKLLVNYLRIIWTTWSRS